MSSSKGITIARGRMIANAGEDDEEEVGGEEGGGVASAGMLVMLPVCVCVVVMVGFGV